MRPPPRGRPSATRRGPPNPGIRPAGCSGGTRATPPAPPRSSRRGWTPRCPGPRGAAGRPTRPPRARPAHPRRARSRPRTARRRPGGRRCAGPPPRSARTGARTHPPPRARPPAPGRTAGPTGPAGRAGGAGPCTASTQRNSGLGHQHHPRSAAERAVVDRAPGVVGPGAQVVHPDVEQAGVRGAPEDGPGAVTRHEVGEDGEDVDPHAVEKALGQVDLHRPGGGVVARHEAHRDEPAGLQHEQVARRVGLDRGDPAQVGSLPVAHRGADELVHPQRSGDFERLGQEVDPVQALRRRAVVDALETHDEGAEAPAAGPAHGPRRAHGERPALALQGRTRVQAPRLVAPEVHQDLTLQAVGPGDPADRQERRFSRRRCPRWPGRRHGRPPR